MHACIHTYILTCSLIAQLAGDLFHDNRPTRRTLHKTMEILRRYCMGPNPVRVQILSSSKPINYQDPNYAVQLPIFSIHGNHDDPSRDAGSRELLAALGVCGEFKQRRIITHLLALQIYCRYPTWCVCSCTVVFLSHQLSNTFRSTILEDKKRWIRSRYLRCCFKKDQLRSPCTV